MSRGAEKFQWIRFLQFGLVLLLGVIVVRGCSQQKIGMDQAIKIAAEAVVPLGYKTQEMRIVCSWKLNHWSVLFSPKAPNILGGTVEVDVNTTTGKVEKILRGQ